MYDNSGNPISASEDQLEEVLLDNNPERYNLEMDAHFTLLRQGYELIVKDIDVNGKRVIVELRKDGKFIPLEKYDYLATDDVNRLYESTFYYRKNIGVQNNLIIIAVHFCDIFNGEIKKYAIIDGVWQLNETPINLKAYKKMDIETEVADNILITSTNKEISLSRNKGTSLFGNFNIKVADNDSLKYYLYRKLLLPGIYEIRSSVAKSASFEWSPMNFAGFYNDINNNISTETLSCHINPSSRKLSRTKPYGVVYQTRAQAKRFKFLGWGSYYAIGFIGDEYFAGYGNSSSELNLIFNKDDQASSFAQRQLEKILIDSDTEKQLKPGESLPLADGYNLSIKKIDNSGNKVYLELINKSGTVVDDDTVAPSVPNASLADQTYSYKKYVGSQKSLVILAVHFKNAFVAPDYATTTVDGVWQISETPISIEEDNSRYDKMTVTNVDTDNMILTMCNKDKEITLKKNITERIIYHPGMEPKQIESKLMGSIWIKAADNDTLRYYLYRKQTINATLKVYSNPSDASVHIDSAPMGFTPLTLSLSSGPHLIELEKNGYKKISFNKDILNFSEELNLNLERMPTDLQNSQQANNSFKFDSKKNNTTAEPINKTATENYFLYVIDLFLSEKMWVIIGGMAAVICAYYAKRTHEKSKKNKRH